MSKEKPLNLASNNFTLKNNSESHDTLNNNLMENVSTSKRVFPMFFPYVNIIVMLLANYNNS